MSEYIALLRGINVGRAKRVAMADLRELMAVLGYTDVRTLLNSGNVLFAQERESSRDVERKIHDAIEKTLHVSTRVVVVPASKLRAVIAENPLAAVATDPSRYLAAFSSSTEMLSKAKPLLQKDWGEDCLVVGSMATYLWCPNGIHTSKLVAAFNRATGDFATTRNWSTVLKLEALLAPDKI